MDTRTADHLRSHDRSIAELQSRVPRLPIREGKVRTLKGRIIRVLVNEPGGVTGADSVVAWDGPLAIVGPEPSETGSFDNSIYQQSYADNDVVFLFWNFDAEQWEPERGGTAGSRVFRFETTAAKDWDDATVAGVLLDAANDPVGDPITLTDRSPAKHQALDGSRGWCLLDGEDDYWILSIDSPARWIEAPLAEVWTLGGTFARVDMDSASAIYWGAAPNHLTPATESYNFGGGGTGLPDDIRNIIKVYDPIELLHRNLVIGEIIRGLWDEDREQFVLAAPPQLSMRLRGTATVTPILPTFTLASPAAVSGRVPTGTIVVENEPALLSDSDPVFAASDNTAGDGTLPKRFTTADMGNFVPALKGLKNWPEDGSSQPLPKSLSHTDADKLVWESVATLLPMLADFSSGDSATQVIGHDGSHALWRDENDSLAFSEGCGIDITDGVVSVVPNEIAGKGLAPDDGECNIAVVAGCGILVEDDVSVDVEGLIGNGLQLGPGGTGECDTIEVKAGCGILVDLNGVAVDFDAIAGPGLGVQAGSGDDCDKLKVNTGCGIHIVADAVAVNYGTGLDCIGGVLVATGLEVTAGCGIILFEGEISVDAADLAGEGLIVGEDCALDVNVGCGLEIVADAVRVKNSDLAGAGLGTVGTCGLEVNVGCGLEIVSDAVKVKTSDLAGLGLIPASGGTCALDVNQGCGLKITDDVLEFDRDDVMGCGLIADDEVSDCGVKVDRDALIGEYLEPDDGDCQIKVTNETTDLIKSIDELTLAIEGNYLVVRLKFTKLIDAVLLDAGTESEETMESLVDVTECT